MLISCLLPCGALFGQQNDTVASQRGKFESRNQLNRARSDRSCHVTANRRCSFANRTISEPQFDREFWTESRGEEAPLSITNLKGHTHSNCGIFTSGCIPGAGGNYPSHVLKRRQDRLTLLTHVTPSFPAASHFGKAAEAAINNFYFSKL